MPLDRPGSRRPARRQRRVRWQGAPPESPPLRAVQCEIRHLPSTDVRHRPRPQHRRFDLDLRRDERANGIVGLLQVDPASAIVTTTRSAKRRNGFRYPAAIAGSGARRRRRSFDRRRLVGSAAPLPSKITRSRVSSAATLAPSSTFETKTAPASPPPHRLQPTVSTPATAAVSR